MWYVIYTTGPSTVPVTLHHRRLHHYHHYHHHHHHHNHLRPQHLLLFCFFAAQIDAAGRFAGAPVRVRAMADLSRRDGWLLRTLTTFLTCPRPTLFTL